MAQMFECHSQSVSPEDCLSEKVTHYCSSSLCPLKDVTCHFDTRQPELVARCGSDVIPGRGKHQGQWAPGQQLVQRETFILLVHQEVNGYIFQRYNIVLKELSCGKIVSH